LAAFLLGVAASALSVFFFRGHLIYALPFGNQYALWQRSELFPMPTARYSPALESTRPMAPEVHAQVVPEGP
jgi:hypothetical protein